MGVVAAGIVAVALAVAQQAPGDLAERGRTLYTRHCANCHGWEGRGELGMGPALNNPDFLAADDVLLWVTIAYGRRETPMFPSLRGLGGARQVSVQQIDDPVAYLRSWQHLR